MPDEKKSVRLTCPICETRLKVADNIQQFNCLNCGTELMVTHEGGIARLEPTIAAAALLTPEQRELIQVNNTLKSKDDNYGSGCAIATLFITLVACVAIVAAGISGQPVFFWSAIISALIILAVVLLLFINASGKANAPLMRRRTQLQALVEQQQGGTNTPGTQGASGGSSS
jgi:hypothetical protein